MEGALNCEWCELQQAVLNCIKCELHLCVACDESLHRKGSRAQHGRAPILGTRRMEPDNRPMLCACEECEEPNSASWLCIDCDQHLCDACKLRLHLKGAATRHILQRSEPFLELQRFQITVAGSRNPFPQRQQSFLHHQVAPSEGPLGAQPLAERPTEQHQQQPPRPQQLLQSTPQPTPPEYRGPVVAEPPHMLSASAPAPNQMPLQVGGEGDDGGGIMDVSGTGGDGTEEEGGEEGAAQEEGVRRGLALGPPGGMVVHGDRPMVYSEMLSAEEGSGGQQTLPSWEQLSGVGTSAQALQNEGMCHTCRAESMNCVCLPTSASTSLLALPPALQTSPRERPPLAAGGLHIVLRPENNEPQLTLQAQMAALQNVDGALNVLDPTGKKRKRCNYPKCPKFAQGSTAFCIKHGGGRRCEHPNCVNSAAGRSSFCGRHGGGRRCNFPGCSHSCKSNQALCVSHGGGRRCVYSGCARGAIGSSEVCTKHGGGPRCQQDGCSKRAEGQLNPYCIAHGGGKRCRFPQCPVSAVRPTDFCKKHGGGKRCSQHGCGKTAVARSKFCARHGGLPRCETEGCTKRAQDKTMLCKKHGGGKRCEAQDCGKSAQSGSRFCSRHGPGRRCEYPNCIKKVKGELNICGYHRRRAEKLPLLDKSPEPPLPLPPTSSTSLSEGPVPMLLSAPSEPPRNLPAHPYPATLRPHTPNTEQGTPASLQSHSADLAAGLPSHHHHISLGVGMNNVSPHQNVMVLRAVAPSLLPVSGPRVIFDRPGMGGITTSDSGGLSMHVQSQQVVRVELREGIDGAVRFKENAAAGVKTSDARVNVSDGSLRGEGSAVIASISVHDEAMAAEVSRDFEASAETREPGLDASMGDAGAEGDGVPTQEQTMEGILGDQEVTLGEPFEQGDDSGQFVSDGSGSAMQNAFDQVDFAGNDVDESALVLGGGGLSEQQQEIGSLMTPALVARVGGQQAEDRDLVRSSPTDRVTAAGEGVVPSAPDFQAVSFSSGPVAEHVVMGAVRPAMDVGGAQVAAAGFMSYFESSDRVVSVSGQVGPGVRASTGASEVSVSFPVERGAVGEQSMEVSMAESELNRSVPKREMGTSSDIQGIHPVKLQPEEREVSLGLFVEGVEVISEDQE